MKIWFERPVSLAVKKLLHAEELFAQIWVLQSQVQDPSCALLFCVQLRDLLIHLERNHFAELLDQRLRLDRHRLEQWEGVIGVDDYRIACLERKIKEASENLATAKREVILCQAEWPLCALQQAYLRKPESIIAHEHPDIIYWLQLPAEQRQLSVQAWLKRLAPIKQALALHLRLLRELSVSQRLMLGQPFVYLALAVGTEFIRVSLSKECTLIPQIFVQALRCMIRFTYPNAQPAEWTPVEVEFHVL